MSGLVGYVSSDEEDDVEPERPAKVAKTAHPATESAERTEDLEADVVKRRDLADRPEDVQSNNTRADSGGERPSEPTAKDKQPQDLPPPGPSAPETNDAQFLTENAMSPYTFERQRLHELTMPTVPNFSIPDSPPPPQTNSEDAATLAATTKKVERFLDLKRKGTHFNQRLHDTPSLRNPSLLPKLMEFAGISTEDSYRSTLEGDMGVPVRWREDLYVEELVKANERREKKRLAERQKLDFVHASKSGGSGGSGTPQSGGEGRKSRFDKK